MQNSLFKAALRGNSCFYAAAALALVASAAQAQVVAPTTTAKPAAAADEESDKGQTIVVTGTRITNPNITSPVPITSISGDEFFKTSNNNIGDVLNDLPQLRSTFAQQNPGSGVGIAGLSLLDLRGLGTSRTLVLVNGRRHVAADILVNAVSPDISSIPSDLIQRTDIVTGAQSAIYGSDAVAGVVNFVLRRSYDGLQVRARGGIAGYGFGANGYVSAMYGKNFADDRGNITLHGEYATTSRIFASDSPPFRSNDALVVVDVDPGGITSGSDGTFDRTFIRDIRSASINRFGLIPITQSGTNPLCGTGIGSTNGAASPIGVNPASNGTPYNCTYIFNAQGSMTAQTGTRVGQGIIGTIYGGNGQTGREDKLISILPSLQRLNFNMLAHFTVSEAFEPFIEAKWNRVKARGSNAGPSFIQGTFTQYDLRERVRLDNPFLSAADRSTISSAILASGCNTSLTAACNVPGITATTNRTTFGGQGVGGPLNAADIAAINNGSYRFVLARNLLDSGIRDEDFQRDTFRIVAGARGKFNEDWNYELSVNYGKFKEDTTTYGYLDRQRFLLSLDAGRNPTTGAIECRAKFDPASATVWPNIPDNVARLSADIAACVPYNPFGAADNSAAAKYFTYNARHQASLSQLDVLGFVGGDTSGFFNMPGGPATFSLGGEYRRERANYTNDAFVESTATNAVVIGQFNPPVFTVKEAFAELNIPIVKDLPLLHSVNVNGAARVSDYNSAVGTVWTYNFGGQWEPFAGLLIRATRGKSVRAPNVSETGFPAVPNFANAFQDPCAAGNIANNASRTANCNTDLGALLPGLPNVGYSLPIISGSNPNLKQETGNSITIGAVFKPEFLPGFSLSVDYYNITVDNVIVSLSAQSIANGCYDQPTLNNPLCSVFTRWRGPGTGPLGELPGQILANSLVSAPVNFAKRERRGIDFTMNFRKKLTQSIEYNSELLYVHGIRSSNYENPSLPAFENRILGELGDPQDEIRWDNDLKINNMTFSYQLRFIGPMYVNAYEDFNELPTACTAAGCPPNNADYADIKQYPAVFYHNLRFQYDVDSIRGVGKGFQFFFGVDNVFNKLPPLGSTATGGGTSIYDYAGRKFYGGFKAKF